MRVSVADFDRSHNLSMGAKGGLAAVPPLSAIPRSFVKRLFWSFPFLRCYCICCRRASR